MATIKWYPLKAVKQLKNAVQYVDRDMTPDEPGDSTSVSSNNIINEIEQLGNLHGLKGKIRAYHVFQNFHPSDTGKLSPEEFTAIGKGLIESVFPSHIYDIKTHTDKAHIHNHIILSAMNYETGKKIRGNYKEYWALRNKSDELCKEHGLHVLDSTLPMRSKNTPEKVRRIMKYNGRSWLFDLSEKADFARHYATNYSEYTSLLNVFNINVRVENKNITYFYPGKEKQPKRGKTLAKKFDKEALEIKFQQNQKLYATRPDIYSKIRSTYEEFKSNKTDIRRADGKLLLDTAGDKINRDQIAQEAAHTKRREHKYTYPSDRELVHSIIPKGELIKARLSNIVDYCKRDKIALEQDQKGNLVLKDRNYVQVSDFEWINNKNRTRGNLIDFVAAHKHVTFLHAISIINNNPRLMLLEKGFEKKNVKFRSFYIPAQDREDWNKSLSKLSSLLESHGVHKRVASTLLNQKQAQVGKDGIIRLFGLDSEEGALEFTEHAPNKWKAERKGSVKSPFFVRNSNSKQALIFTDPMSTLKQIEKEKYGYKKGPYSVLGLLEPSAEQVDIFIAQNKHITDIKLVPGNGKHFSKDELDLFNTLKKKLDPFGIKVEQSSIEKELPSRSRELEF